MLQQTLSCIVTLVRGGGETLIQSSSPLPLEAFLIDWQNCCSVAVTLAATVSVADTHITLAMCICVEEIWGHDCMWQCMGIQSLGE